ncbi:MAG: aldo/keto reductase [Bacteroidia bacterium]
MNTKHTLQLGGDMTINRLGYGAMRITGDGVWGPPKDKAEAIKVLRDCVELGLNFIDTADAYGPNVSEELIAEALHPYRDELVIATKGGLTRQGPNQWKARADPQYLEDALKGSLKRLKLERIDLYQLHRIDANVPLGESLGKLKELQDQGYIRHLGLSEVSEEELAEAAKHIKIVSLQNRYSLRYRKWENELKWCEANGAAFIPWYPLDAGDMDNETLKQIATKYEASVYQIAIAWLLKHSEVMVPIPGTSSSAHLAENVAAGQIELSAEDFAAISALADA